VNAQDLIASSMRLIGALGSGETPTAAEASDSLLVLNQMLDSWNADRLMVFTITIGDFPLTPSQQVYTYGPGGNFNGVRPSKIESISIVSLTNPAQPLEIPIDVYTDSDWQQLVPVKIITTTLPTAVYDDGAYPLRNLSYWPIPTVAVNTRIYGWTALGQFPDLNTQLFFPPGYPEALRYNLAVRLMAEMPGDFHQITAGIVQSLAVETLARVKSINMPIIQSSIDPALTGQGARYNYFSDQPVGGKR
jgi:hypothetical protein